MHRKGCRDVAPALERRRGGARAHAADHQGRVRQHHRVRVRAGGHRRQVQVRLPVCHQGLIEIDHHHQSCLGWAFGMKMKRRRMHENLIPTAGVVSSVPHRAG